MAHTLALITLIYFTTAALWDLLDPDAVRIEFGSTFRALTAAAFQVFLIVACGIVLGLSTAVIVCFFLGALVLELLSGRR